jgi:hypothetical protein
MGITIERPEVGFGHLIVLLWVWSLGSSV